MMVVMMWRLIMLEMVDLVGSDIIPSSTPPSHKDNDKPFLTSSLSGTLRPLRQSVFFALFSIYFI